MNLTPQRKLSSRGNSYSKFPSQHQSRTSSLAEISILKDYQSLKIQVKQLQAKNKTMAGQIDQLLYEKSYSENKYIQKINFEEQTLAQYQKQKNYQLELLQIKHEEEKNQLQREKEIQNDELIRDLKQKNFQIHDKNQKIRYLELNNEELKKECGDLERALFRMKQNQHQMTEEMRKIDSLNKQLELVNGDKERQKRQMEEEIRVLLNIESEKSRKIYQIQAQLRNSEQNERKLSDKLALLGEQFAKLEEHILVFKEKLNAANSENDRLSHLLISIEGKLQEKEKLLFEQLERENLFRKQYEEIQIREKRREKETYELMSENERLYKDIAYAKHRLHEFGIAYNVDV